MSILCMNAVLDSATELDQVETLVLIVLAQHANDQGGNCWPSQQTIATKARATTRGVRNVLSRLVGRGLISVVSEPSAKRSARYQIHLDAFTPPLLRPEPGSSLDASRPEPRSPLETSRPEPGSAQEVSRQEHGSSQETLREEPGSPQDAVRPERGSAQTGTGFLSEGNGVPLRPERGSSDPSLISPVTVQEHTHTVTTSDRMAIHGTEIVVCVGDVAITERDREFVGSRPLTSPDAATTNAPTLPPAISPFEAFWAAYPRKVARVPAARAWTAASAAATTPEILSGLAKWKASAQWREVMATDPELRRIPHAATWLNQRRWEEPPVSSLTLESLNGGTVMSLQKELVRLLDAAGVKRYDREHWFTSAQILHDRTTGQATLVIADAQRREFIERNYHEALEAAVVAQGGRRLRICGSAAA